MNIDWIKGLSLGPPLLRQPIPAAARHPDIPGILREEPGVRVGVLLIRWGSVGREIGLLRGTEVGMGCFGGIGGRVVVHVPHQIIQVPSHDRPLR